MLLKQAFETSKIVLWLRRVSSPRREQRTGFCQRDKLITAVTANFACFCKTNLCSFLFLLNTAHLNVSEECSVLHICWIIFSSFCFAFLLGTDRKTG